MEIRWLIFCVIKSYKSGSKLTYQKQLILIAVIVVVVGIGVYVLYNKTAFMDYQRLDNQLSQLIKQKDAKQIKEIAIGNDTYNFLMNLPQTTKPQKTSDSQGISENIEYFVTVLDGKKVDVLLKQYFRYGGLIRKVELYQISLQ